MAIETFVPNGEKGKDTGTETAIVTPVYLEVHFGLWILAPRKRNALFQLPA